MFKFLSNIPKAFKKMSNTQKAVVLAVIGAIIIVCYLYRQQISDFFVGLKNKISGIEHFEQEENEVVQQNEETFAIKGKGKQLVLFYAPWCPHCKTMMADWDKFAADNKSSVKAIKVNSDEQPDLVKEYSVQGSQQFYS